MTIETQKNFIGKTQTLLMAEVQSERWLSLVRLVLGAIFLAVSVVQLAFNYISLNSFLIQIGSILVLFAYSSYFLFGISKKLVQGYFVFILISLDVSIITLILYSYVFLGAVFPLNTSAIFGAYFIAISFTALHHRLSLSIFCGLMSVIGYSFLYFLYLQSTHTTPHYIGDYIVRVCLLLVIASLSGIISTNNKKTIQQVVSSEVRYHNLVHRLPEMLFTLDIRGNFLWSNMASHTILGIPAKVIVGRNIRSFLVQPETLKLDRSGIRGTFEIVDFNRSHKFVDCVIQAVEEENGRVAFDGIITDVTDRELAISQREEMVNRLFQYQKMESLGTLASGMAHDFNNILQTVQDNVSMVLQKSNEPFTKERMEIIKESMGDARFLISELLALGRKKPLDYKAINVGNFIENILHQFSNQLGKKYPISFEVPEKPLWIQGDADYLKRVFQNLIGNAKDAMGEGGNITISCTYAPSQGESGNIIIRIADSGSGISPELTEKIFDPFFTTKKPGKGTGLGLALVRRIIMLHNGSIYVERTDSSGTVFKIEIPESDVGQADSDTKALLLNRIPSTVLLLDDDPKIRDILKFFLKEFNYPTCEASNREEACKALEQNLPDCNVVIMDWKFPNDDPHEIISSLRTIKNDIIIIVVSGYSPINKSIQSMRIFKWLTKPYDKNQLDLEIQRALHQQKPAEYPTLESTSSSL